MRADIIYPVECAAQVEERDPLALLFDALNRVIGYVNHFGYRNESGHVDLHVL